MSRKGTREEVRSSALVRIATYNIHRSRGMDGRVRPHRVVDVLREIDADVVALQEVLSIEGHSPEKDQARYIAAELGFHFALGENRRLKGGAYGNVVLSRYPLRTVRNYDLTVSGCERRGCLRTDIRLPQGVILHVFNVHLGLALLERRHQGRHLADRILSDGILKGPRIMLGDFNEWTRGLTSRLLGRKLKSVNLRRHLRWGRTYPGLMPVLALDHIYFDPTLELKRLTLHRTRQSLMASDHLPLVADFELVEKRQDALREARESPLP
jgi:endonuclease/exonuclease/phosphatase family metal-dependent hydrolase